MTAKQVILAAGPWISGLVPGLARHLKVTRQAVGWFKPAKPETVAYGEFPIFIIEGKRGMIYGFPDFEGRGVKAARHDHGPVVGADDWHPPATDEELEAVAITLAELVPGAAGSIADRDICLYASISRASEAVCLTETRCMSEPMMSAIGNFSPAATYELIGASGPFFGGQRLTTSHSLYSMQPSTRSQIGPLAQPDRHSPLNLRASEPAD